ncbi:hypothetical protein G9C98_006157 [Cotesia typhae]|uniref:Thyroid transcription factor 1-associated protein 26 n=1 Tax=Cotesia typhae TaxID=2053667 RepID=A0A8J5UZ42_9HYME|nr:hypothetical protein G9C98_006157 [Cotesia typhae]
MGRFPKKGQNSDDSLASGSNKTVGLDKKKYREAKYSNHYKVDKWVSKRKNVLLHELKNEAHVSKKFIKSIASRDTRGNKNLDKIREKQANLQKERSAKKEEFIRKTQERKEAIKKSKQKRFEAFKKLSKRTKKGQPVMKDRIEMLLQKIQASAN